MGIDREEMISKIVKWLHEMNSTSLIAAFTRVEEVAEANLPDVEINDKDILD